jgi:multiple sugar transport system permease protein
MKVSVPDRMEATILIPNTPAISSKRMKGFRNFLTAMLFISPFIVGFIVFNLYPILMSFYYSFTNFNILQKASWVGFDNYTKLASDPLIWKSILNTGYMIVIGIPLITICSLLIAVLLNVKIPGAGLFRTIIYMPAVVPPVATALLFTWILNPNYGLINVILGWFNISGPGWLGDTNWSKPAIMLMVLWTMGNVMVLYLAALREVPEDLYEAAQIDGANKIQMFFHVTIPEISPVIFFNVISGIIAFTQFFTQVYVVNSTVNGVSALGAPNHSTLFYAVYLYQNGFAFFKMGYASAMAWILLIISVIATWAMLKYSGTLTDLDEKG